VKYFKHDIKGAEVNLYPLVCWHIGSPQSDLGFIEQVIKRVKNDPLARWLYLGDGGECATKHSKGDIYSQTLSPTQQQNRLVDLLKPIVGKGLFGIRGNHGNRIYKETGLDFDETLLAKLGLPYLGVAAFWHLNLHHTDRVVPFSIFAHHGVDSGVSFGTKVNKAKAFETQINADAILTAHSHIAVDLPPRYMASLRPNNSTINTDPVYWSATHEYVCGSAYDSRSGYAEEKGYPPLLPSHLVIKFKVVRSDRGGITQRLRQQSSEIIRKEI
jgi:hypothetical protein